MSLTQARPTRILEMTKAFFIGGTEVQVLELLRGLPSHYDIEVAVLEEVGPLMEEVWKEGFWSHVFPLGKSFVSFQAAHQVFRMAVWLRRHDIDLVHAHDFYSTLLAVPACLLSRTPVVVSRLDLLHWHGTQRARALALLTQRANHVIANADAIRRHLIEKEGVPESHVSVIRNGIDLERLKEKQDRGLSEPLPEIGNAPLIAHVANMGHEVKRQEDVIDALPMVLAQCGPVHVAFVGDGDRRAFLMKRAQDKKVAAYTHFLGYRQDVAAILKRATMGVLSSENEGLSNAVMEGMAACLPMVVTHVGGNPELVAHGKRGLVVPPRSPRALASAMIELLKNPPGAQQMGLDARRFVEDELTLNRMVAAHEAVYRHHARKRSPGATIDAHHLRNRREAVSVESFLESPQEATHQRRSFVHKT